jgi:heterodisulfide reductase subunit B
MKHANPIFWGCTLTHNFPFLIKSTRKVLDKIGIETNEIPDFSCCPDPVYLKTYGKDINLALSARNLALAEKKLKINRRMQRLLQCLARSSK